MENNLPNFFFDKKFIKSILEGTKCVTFRKLKEPDQPSKPLGFYNLCTGTKDKPKVCGQIQVLRSGITIFDGVISEEIGFRRSINKIEFFTPPNTIKDYLLLDAAGFKSVKDARSYYDAQGITEGTLCYAYQFCLVKNP